MKMIMSSAFSSGLLLFGISMLYGTTGTLNLPNSQAHLNGNSLQIFSFILLLAGFAFKISVVPFHLWTADVYEGSRLQLLPIYLLFQKAPYYLYLFLFYTMFLHPLQTAGTI